MKIFWLRTFCALIAVCEIHMLQAQSAAAPVCPDSILNKARIFVVDLAAGDSTVRQHLLTRMVSKPTFVECYADNSRGDTLSGTDFIHQFPRIFDQLFFDEVNALAHDNDRLRNSILKVGSFWVLSVNVNYTDEYNGRSRLFKIRILNSGFEWMLIQCAG